MIKIIALSVVLVVIPLTSTAGIAEGVSAFEAKRYEAARAEFEPLAGQGDADAQYYLGELYWYGLGIEKNRQIAIEWYRKAADQGHAVAQYVMGYIYASGKADSKDSSLAIAWFERAAASGHRQAFVELEAASASGDSEARSALARLAPVQQKMRLADEEEAVKRAAGRKSDSIPPKLKRLLTAPDLATAFAQIAEAAGRSNAATTVPPVAPPTRYAPAPFGFGLFFKDEFEWDILNNEVVQLRLAGQYDQALAKAENALAVAVRVFGKDHPNAATSMTQLAITKYVLGQYAQAEQLYKQALAIAENSLGFEHFNVASILTNLAVLYKTQQRSVLAEQLFRRAADIVEKVRGPKSPELAQLLMNLGTVYSAQEKYSDAKIAYSRALKIAEEGLGSEHIVVATALHNLASLELGQGRLVDAEPRIKHALAISERLRGPNHSVTTRQKIVLANLYQAQGRYELAEDIYLKALRTDADTFGSDHINISTTQGFLARLYAKQGAYPKALASARLASAIARKRLMISADQLDGSQEGLSSIYAIFHHLWLLERDPNNDGAEAIADEAFQLIQMAQPKATAAAVIRMASRISRGDSPLATLVRRKQDIMDRQSREAAKLVREASKAPAVRNTAIENSLRTTISSLLEDVEAIDRELSIRFPDYQELNRIEPISLRSVQKMLQPGEAMLVYGAMPARRQHYLYMDSEARKRLYLWVIRPDSVKFLPIDVSLDRLETDIRASRDSITSLNSGGLPNVDVANLHSIYRTVLAPAEAHLDGVKQIIVVPSEILTEMPFSVLVATPENSVTKISANYSRVNWFGLRYPISYLPSVSSFLALRKIQRAGLAKEPFVGFGDPLLEGGLEGRTRNTASLRVGDFYRDVGSGNVPRTAGVADAKLIRQQVRLPETEMEIREMAKILRADQDSIWLQERATERNVKAMDLARYRTIAFATHGVMAGEIGPDMEPGLLLTPPLEGTTEDDGYLSAGEIAELKINAEFVILSACNTAAADGKPGSEGMSGLAKAFFYAGARSLLVSHWPVASEAAVPLTTGILREYEDNPDAGHLI